MRNVRYILAILFIFFAVGCAEPQDPTIIVNEGDINVYVDNDEDELPTDDDDSAEDIDEHNPIHLDVWYDEDTAPLGINLIAPGAEDVLVGSWQLQITQAGSITVPYIGFKPVIQSDPDPFEPFVDGEDDGLSARDMVTNCRLGHAYTGSPISASRAMAQDADVFRFAEKPIVLSMDESVSGIALPVGLFCSFADYDPEDVDAIAFLFSSIQVVDSSTGEMVPFTYYGGDGTIEAPASRFYIELEPARLVVSIHPQSPSGPSVPGSMQVGLIFSITSIGADITLQYIGIETQSTDNAGSQWNRCGTWGAPGHFQLTEWLGNGSSLSSSIGYFDEFAQGCVSWPSNNGNVLGQVDFLGMSTTVMDGETKTFALGVSTGFWLGGDWVSADPESDDTVAFSVTSLGWQTTRPEDTELYGFPAVGGTLQY